jgi:uncharacterized protein (TIGR02444 family)
VPFCHGVRHCVDHSAGLMRRKAFAFWRFSLRTYRQSGVAEACLALQDEYGADVNLLLYCSWMGRCGRKLDSRATRSAMAAVGRWQKDVVWSLRRARRAIRKDPHGAEAEAVKLLRRSIAAAELDAEYLEQRLLATEAARTQPSAGNSGVREATKANLARYFGALGATLGPRARRHVRTLIDATVARTARLKRTRG